MAEIKSIFGLPISSNGGGKVETIYDFTSTEEVLDITLDNFTKEIVEKLTTCKSYTITLCIPRGSETVTHNLRFGVYKSLWYSFVDSVHSGNYNVPNYADVRMTRTYVNCGGGTFVGCTTKELRGNIFQSSVTHSIDRIFEMNETIRVVSDKPLPIGTKISMTITR